MWERLKQSDITEAKQQLRLRVDETLRRHAEELKGLDNDLAEIDLLNRLVDKFSDRFGTMPVAVVTGGKGDAASNSNAGEKPSARNRQSEAETGGRERPRTNFDAFTRAVAKNERSW